jgi:nitrate reductase gamma subunit
MLMLFSYWLTGSVPGAGDKGPFGKLFRLLWSGIKSVFSVKIFFMIKAVILDVLFQRRLFRQSRVRWLIHSLIFFPFVFRFSWGIVALLGSLWKGESPWVWALVDRNYPVTALLFDLSGVMLMLGVTLAFVRGAFRQLDQPPGLPTQDRLALLLMAGIVLVGFILEGMRIAMTGWPEGAGYSAVGFVLSVLFLDPFPSSDLYGYVWYVHAILTGIFIAYLPFSRLLHIIMSPVALAMHAIYVKEHHRG